MSHVTIAAFPVFTAESGDFRVSCLMSHSQDDGAEAHARGGSHGGQCRRQGCDDDAQRNLNDLRFQFHDKRLKIKD